VRGDHAPASADRRALAKRDLRVVVPDKLQRGWLAFQSQAERRRLAPVPPAWQNLSDEELLVLLDGAELVGRRKRLVE
jgi:hypothetical protein